MQFLVALSGLGIQKVSLRTTKKRSYFTLGLWQVKKCNCLFFLIICSLVQKVSTAVSFGLIHSHFPVLFCHLVHKSRASLKTAVKDETILHAISLTPLLETILDSHIVFAALVQLEISYLILR